MLEAILEAMLEAISSKCSATRCSGAMCEGMDEIGSEMAMVEKWRSRDGHGVVVGEEKENLIK